ncbi:MAG: AAA family ATPase [Chloroflexia bacterium]|nr:AAA family ATPase [Chloroflexia bacterium]
MTKTDDLQAILDRLAAGEHSPADLETLRRALIVDDQARTVQLGKYNVDIGRGQEIQIGDRIYQGSDAEAVRQVVLSVLQEHDLLSHTRPKVYHYLPHPNYEHFVGRKAELEQAHHLLRPHHRAWVIVVDGIGGIGKSALALELAHHYLRNHDKLPLEQRFEAIIWTSAKAMVLTADGIKPRQQIVHTLEDIYATISVALEREDIVRARSEEQAALVYRALSKQRTLLVIDNLETIDDERVNAFIRELPAPTKCIVTTRHRIDVAYPIRLEEMPKEEAIALIGQECISKEVSLSNIQAQRLYRRTGGVPLAIVWSIAQIGYGYPVEMVLRRLGTPTSDITRYCFEGIIERIRDKPAHKLLMALALFEHKTSRESLGIVADLSDLDRDEGMVDLERLSLVNKEGALFGLLPLTRNYALNELAQNTSVKTGLEERWLGYLKQLCGIEAGEDFWRWIGQASVQDGPNIVAAADWAYDHGRTNDVLVLSQGACWYLEFVGRWREESEYARRAYTLALAANQYGMAARFMGFDGWIRQQWGEYDEAEGLFREALEHYQNAGNREGECVTRQYLALVFRKRQQFKQAEEYCLEAQRIAKELQSGDLKAMIDNEQGKLARDMGDWPRAWHFFSQVRDWFASRVEQTPRDEVLALGNWGQLAWVAYHLGRIEEARELFGESLRYFEEGSKAYLATLKYRFAIVEDALGNSTQAYKYAKEAAFWFERLGMQPDYEAAQKLLARLESQLDR